MVRAATHVLVMFRTEPHLPTTLFFKVDIFETLGKALIYLRRFKYAVALLAFVQWCVSPVHPSDSLEIQRNLRGCFSRSMFFSQDHDEDDVLDLDAATATG